MVRRICLNGRTIDVAQTLDQWPGTDYRYVKVKGRDGHLYMLRHDETHGDWELTMFQRAGSETATPRPGGSRLRAPAP